MGDVKAVHAYFSDLQVRQYLGGHPPRARKSIASHIRRMRVCSTSWTVILKETGAVIGECDLFHIVDDRIAELGYILSSSHWGQGYMQEACLLALEYGFSALGLSRIHAAVDARNHRSLVLLQRLGFSKDVSTVSLYAAQSFRQVHDSQKYLVPTIPYENIVDPMIARTFASALSATVEQWGQDLLLVFSPVMANNLAKMGYTPRKIQTELYKTARVPRKLFGPRPLGALGRASSVPPRIDNAKDDELVPVVPGPEDFRIVVAGGTGGGASFAVDHWGFGNSLFVTKEVKLPPQWPQLVTDLERWSTPIVVR